MDVIVRADEIPPDLWDYFEPVPSSPPMTDVFRLSPEPYDAEFCTACGGYYTGAAKSAIRTVTVPREGPATAVRTPKGAARETLGLQSAVSGLHEPGWRDGAPQTVDGERRRLCPCGRWDAWLSHFAVFPSEIPRRAILAGTSAHGACPTCGAGWRRTTSSRYVKSPVHGDGSVVGRHYVTGANGWDGAGYPRLNKATETTGWAPGCTCPNAAAVVPPLVLDPFSGSGTTALVAHQLGRRAIGIELSGPYAAMSRARISSDAPLVEAVAAADVWAQGALF